MPVPDFGVGVDIESIGRFKKTDGAGDSAFLNKIFTTAEIDYCFSLPQPAQHLAARYAAKEAVIKALATLKKTGLSYKDIEVINDKDGAPSARIRKAGFDALDIKLSLSHAGGQAIAFTVVSRK